MPVSSPIGLFDSGVGGLTVMREVASLLPYEDIIYLGDTARVPYGTRSPETILKYTLEGASFLCGKKIKLLIIACHTACSHALEALQKRYQIPVLGVIEGGLAQVQVAGGSGPIGVFGTTSTIGSGLYQALIQARMPQAEIFSVPCPLFVPLIEEGLYEHPAAHLIAEHYLGFLRPKNLSAALLACTHYPLLRPVIQAVLGEHVALVEPAEATAEKARQLLISASLLQSERNRHLQFYATDDPLKFTKLAKRFFGLGVERVEHISF